MGGREEKEWKFCLQTTLYFFGRLVETLAIDAAMFWSHFKLEINLQKSGIIPVSEVQRVESTFMHPSLGTINIIAFTYIYKEREREREREREVQRMKRFISYFSCKVGSLPTTHLGFPLGVTHKFCAVWDLVEVGRRLTFWKKQYLSSLRACYQAF